MYSQSHERFEQEVLTIVDRNDMQGISSMHVEGEARNLGIVKNFKDNATLNEFLPNELSISWAHLDPGECLDTHRHPVASLIIAVEGVGCSQGDTELRFNGGNALLIPAWNEHGFTGGDPEGLWALSIQFSDIAIFESEIDPLTTFHDSGVSLPPLEARQLLKIDREELCHPTTFKRQAQLHKVLPSNVDFYWEKIEEDTILVEPTADIHKLIIIGSEGGVMKRPYQQNLQAGMAFWQMCDIHLCSTEHPLWVLTIEVKK